MLASAALYVFLPFVRLVQNIAISVHKWLFVSDCNRTPVSSDIYIF